MRAANADMGVSELHGLRSLVCLISKQWPAVGRRLSLPAVVGAALRSCMDTFRLSSVDEHGAAIRKLGLWRQKLENGAAI